MPSSWVKRIAEAEEKQKQLDRRAADVEEQAIRKMVQSTFKALLETQPKPKKQ